MPLLHALEVRPSSEAYNVLGALYARSHNLACAIVSFKKALTLQPNAWRTHYNLALALLSNNDLRRAANELEIAVKEKPDSYVAHNALGLVVGRLGQLDQATEEFERAHDLNPNDPYVSSNLAEADMAMKRYSAAIYYLKQALALSPPPEIADRVEMDLAVAYSENGQYGMASQVFRKMIAEHPRSARLHFNLATSDAHDQNYVEAAQEYKRALELDPSNDVTRLSLAKALVIFDHVQQAVPYAARYTRDEPNDAEGYIVLGEAYKTLGEFQPALKALRRAVELDPNSFKARYNLGFVLERTGQTQEAIQELQRAQALRPNSPDATYELGMILARQKKGQAAMQEFRAFQETKVGKDKKEKAGVLNNQGNADLAAGKYQDAAQVYQQAVVLDPSNAQWRYNYALALVDLNNGAEAERQLEKAEQLDSNLSNVHNELGLCYLSDGRLREAEKEFKAALQIDPEFADAESNLGVLEAREGKYQQALSLFRQATLNNPRYAQAYLNWGLILASKGNYDEASALFEKAIKISPNYASAYTALGKATSKEGHKREAVSILRKALTLEPNSPVAHLNVGIALADTGQFGQALSEFQDAARLDPKDAAAHYNEGRVLWQLDRSGEASQELQKACQLNPNYQPAVYLLAGVERHERHLRRSAALLRKVVEIDPFDAAAEDLLAQDLNDLGEEQEAVDHWRLALKANPDDTQALYNLARTLGSSSSSEAKQDLARFQQLQRQQMLADRIRTLGNFGLQAANNRQWSRAVGDLQQAIGLCGSCAEGGRLHEDLGLIYARQGDVTHAKAELKTALKIDPKDGKALQAMRVLATMKPAGSSLASTH
jgi:tetratricopeptide (TPR) repeat protein